MIEQTKIEVEPQSDPRSRFEQIVSLPDNKNRILPNFEINRIYNESNCDTMRKMPNEFVDLVVTSPPYDELRNYKGYEWNFEEVAKELYRILKPGGIVVWVVNDSTVDGSETLTSFKQAIYFKENCGFSMHDTMIYEKNGASYPTQERYYQCFEYIFVLSKGTPKTINLLADRRNKWIEGSWGKRTRRNKDGELVTGDKIQAKEFGVRFNIWRYNTGKGFTTNDDIAYEHPAIFPEQLAKDHILSWSNEGDLIYDPFMGSGTVAKVCIVCNRNYVGSEISQEYCTIAERRLQPYKAQLHFFNEVN